MEREGRVLRMLHSDEEADRREVEEYYGPGWRRRMGMPSGEEVLAADHPSPPDPLSHVNGERGSSESWEGEHDIIPSPDPSPNMGRGEERTGTSIGRGEERYDGEQVCFGVDWGKDNDFTCVSVMTRSGRQIYLERFNQIGWAVQRGRLTALYERFKPFVIVAEENSIESVNIEALQAEDLPVRGFNTTRKSKAPLIEGLSLAIEKEEVVLLNDETLKNELMAYEMTRTAYGWTYSAPPGGHDDTVMATALSLWAIRQHQQTRIDWV